MWTLSSNKWAIAKDMERTYSISGINQSDFNTQKHHRIVSLDSSCTTLQLSMASFLNWKGQLQLTTHLQHSFGFIDEGMKSRCFPSLEVQPPSLYSSPSTSTTHSHSFFSIEPSKICACSETSSHRAHSTLC